jgi:hypothetical protein
MTGIRETTLKLKMQDLVKKKFEKTSNMVWIRFLIWIRNRKRNRNYASLRFHNIAPYYRER